jgi:hypothetical protein
VRKLAVIVLLSSFAARAAALSPFVQGGVDDVRAGDWTFYTNRGERLIPVGYGAAFYLGGGLTYDIVKFRQKGVVPTLSLDTDIGFTRFRREWREVENLEGRTQTFTQLTAAEELMFRIKIPAGSRLITPFFGIGGGFAAVSSSVGIMEEYVQPGEEGYYEDSTASFNTAYAVPFGLEITLSPSSTIYWRFGPLAPAGKVTYEYQTGPARRERVDSSIPNSFLAIFGYRWGQ